jgi:hypothetical protein
MPSNTNIITTTAKEAVKRSVVNYGAGVYAHTTGDWTHHNVLRVYNLPYFDSLHDRVSLNALRIVATLDDGSAQGLNLPLEMPLNPDGTTAITSSPPIIIQQPRNTSRAPNTLVQLTVAVISDIPVTYQWYKNSVAISGKTASSLVFPSVQLTDAGLYKVLCRNANGSVMSTEAELRVVTGATTDEEGGSFFENLPPVKLFGFLSDLF